MIHSITSNWQTPKEKFWAIWYWNKIARRQTAPIHLHAHELTDPIRQFNDHGYVMCSTVAGVNCAIWGAMGYNVKFWDISLHTVPEVEYDGGWHMYDSSLSALYTTCDGKKLTDGIVGPPVSGGTAFKPALIWNKGSNPEITVDLGKAETCGAFRIQLGGYPWWDAVKGEVKDKVEVLISNDGNAFQSVGFFNLNLRWKDVPANHAFNDDEKFCGHNFEMIPEKPVEARYVRFVVTPVRGAVTVSEVQVLDFIRYEPFDLRIALPDGRDRSDIAQYNPKHAPMKPYKPNRGD